MKNSQVLMMVVLSLGLCAAGWALNFDTTFSYQGRLTDDGAPANHKYDFRFKLYSDAGAVTQVGSTLIIEDTQTSDGYFKVELDFGAVFDGQARWLEIGVRPYDDAGGFTTLDPLQKVTPAPYALYAKTSPPGNTLDAADGDPIDVLFVDEDGNVGIGTTDPNEKLHVQGGVKIADGSQGQGKVLTSDADGAARWQTPPAAAIPAGVIVMWSGSLVNIPSGWALCDGANGTPDLRDRFMVGAGNTYIPGAAGGSSSHTHGPGSYTAPSHAHTFTGSTGTSNSNTMTPVSPQQTSCARANHGHSFTGTTDADGEDPISGTSAAASSLPPYYALAFIMKL